jgi:hypothetical protein
MARDEVRIGERAYGGRMGNGPEGSGDGFKFRGRGIIQITGRENYGKAGTALGLNLLEHPELLEEPEAACASAGWYWSTHDCNALADAGDFEGITRRINGRLNGLADRKAWLAKVYHALGTQAPAPIEDRSPPPLRQRKGEPMGALALPLLQSILPSILQLFSGRAQAQIAKVTGADPAVAGQFLQDLMGKVGDAAGVPVTDAATAIRAVGVVTEKPDPETIKSLEDHSLDYLDKLAPLIDKIESYDRTAFTDTEASRDASAKRAAVDPFDPAPILTYFGLLSVGVLTAFLCAWISIALWHQKGVGVEMWAALTGMIGWLTAKVGSIFDNRFGTTRSSAAKDVVIGELARR